MHMSCGIRTSVKSTNDSGDMNSTCETASNGILNELCRLFSLVKVSSLKFLKINDKPCLWDTQQAAKSRIDADLLKSCMILHAEHDWIVMPSIWDTQTPVATQR